MAVVDGCRFRSAKSRPGWGRWFDNRWRSSGSEESTGEPVVGRDDDDMRVDNIGSSGVAKQLSHPAPPQQCLNLHPLPHGQVGILVLRRGNRRILSLALLERPVMSKQRTIGMLTLRGYLLFVFALVIVKVVEVANGR